MAHSRKIKKQQYSNILEHFYKIYQQNMKLYKNEVADKDLILLKSCGDSFNCKLSQNGDSVQLSSNEPQQIDVMYSEMLFKIMKDYLDNKIIHYFINDYKLKIFLEEIEVKDFTNVKNLLVQNGTYSDAVIKGKWSCENQDNKMEEYNTPKNVILSKITIGIHLPETKESYCASISIDENDLLRLQVFNNEGYCFTSDSSCFEKLKNGNYLDQQDYKTIKLIINLLYYIDAFPEKILNGIPKNCILKDNFELLKNKINVGMSEKIIQRYEKSQDGKEIIPHFRSGHFRFLGSNYYKKMKGKTIFIESTFVKGKDKNSKTVIK